jgi:hypothetical protein
MVIESKPLSRQALAWQLLMPDEQLHSSPRLCGVTWYVVYENVIAGLRSFWDCRFSCAEWMR